VGDVSWSVALSPVISGLIGFATNWVAIKLPFFSVMHVRVRVPWLRTLATRSALLIQDPGVPFLSLNELNLLAWLAQAQRVASYTRQFHPDPMLTMTIVHCAGTLDAMGIRLPSLAIYNPSVRPAYG